MSSLWTSCACIVVLVLYGVRAQSVESCSNPVARTAEFSLRSHKDVSGRWVAEVGMEHEDRPEAWTVDVKQTIEGCPGNPKVKVTAKLTAPPPKAPPGYELHRGVGYYKIHTDKMTWHEAKAKCESEGTHLAILNSEAESAVLVKMLAPLFKVASWIFVGFHDMYTEGQFLTIFDEPINGTGFKRWAGASQPDNAGGSATSPGEDCGSIHSANGGLNDMPCLSMIPFICEQEI